VAAPLSSTSSRVSSQPAVGCIRLAKLRRLMLTDWLGVVAGREGILAVDRVGYGSAAGIVERVRGADEQAAIPKEKPLAALKERSLNDQAL
jgi:hypothetical protein